MAKCRCRRPDPVTAFFTREYKIDAPTFIVATAITIAGVNIINDLILYDVVQQLRQQLFPPTTTP